MVQTIEEGGVSGTLFHQQNMNMHVIAALLWFHVRALNSMIINLTFCIPLVITTSYVPIMCIW